MAACGACAAMAGESTQGGQLQRIGINGMSLAESKIDEFVRTAGTESAWQIVALDDLKHEITDRGWGTTCSGHMLDYIAQQRAAIAAKCEPL